MRINLNQSIRVLSLILLFLYADPSHSGSPKKKTINTQIYESEGQETEFTAKVKVVRDWESETEVFFENAKNSGPYVLRSGHSEYGALKARLEKSKKPNGPMVKVSVDNDQIKTVEIEAEGRKPAHSDEDFFNSSLKK